jgi:hypothetical protein
VYHRRKEMSISIFCRSRSQWYECSFGSPPPWGQNTTAQRAVCQNSAAWAVKNLPPLSRTNGSRTIVNLPPVCRLRYSDYVAYLQKFSYKFTKPLNQELSDRIVGWVVADIRLVPDLQPLSTDLPLPTRRLSTLAVRQHTSFPA